MMMMPAHTITNANMVPMLVIFPTTAIGANAANSDTNTIRIRLQRHGVRNRGWTSRNTLGSNRSFAMEKKTRDWPRSMTSMTEVRPASTARFIAVRSHGYGICRSARDSGAATLSSR